MKDISFTAERVAALVEDFTETFRVYGVYFETGDPEAGGQSWNFTRSFEDDQGVCTVQEPQLATLYDGIESLHLSRSLLVCRFDPDGRKASGCSCLEISLQLDDTTWSDVARVMDLVCSGKTFYRRT
jgi:hypothetical protein